MAERGRRRSAEETGDELQSPQEIPEENMEHDNITVTRVEYEPPPATPKKGKPPTETQAILTCCDWLEGTSKDDLPELAVLQRVRVLVADRNLTLAWQVLIPMIEGRRGASIVTG